MARFQTLEELMDYITIDTSGNVVIGKLKTTAAASTVRAVTQSALVGATVALAQADSGGVFENQSTSGSPSWTLPTTPTTGTHYTFIVSNVTTGFTVTGGTIKAKANPNGAAITGTTLTHTQGTAIIGDSITVVYNGTNWYSTSQLGIFAAA